MQTRIGMSSHSFGYVGCLAKTKKKCPTLALALLDGRHKRHQRLPQLGVRNAYGAAAADVLRRHLIDAANAHGARRLVGSDGPLRVRKDSMNVVRMT